MKKALLSLLAILIWTVSASVNSANSINGSDGDDRLAGTVSNDTIRAGAGDDIIEGGPGDDQLHGGDGDDVLIGGIGLDRLFGGLGADEFVIDILTDEADEILDFNPEEGDTIVLKVDRSKNSVVVLPGRIKVNNFQMKSNGDLRAKFGGKTWNKLVNINRSDLVVNVKDDGHKVVLKFRKRI
jgi:hypothetical protein